MLLVGVAGLVGERGEHFLERSVTIVHGVGSCIPATAGASTDSGFAERMKVHANPAEATRRGRVADGRRWLIH
jgi:hypothetical protein